MEEDEEVSWLLCPYHAPVLDAAGNEIGTSESLLGDEKEDIFHGVVVKLRAGGDYRELPAGSIAKITRSNLQTIIAPGEADSLEPYQEQRWYHIGWGGLFRRHPEWKDGE
jgi:hypothetical protein